MAESRYEFAEFVRSRRRAIGLSVAALAKEAGVSRTFVTKLERGNLAAPESGSMINGDAVERAVARVRSVLSGNAEGNAPASVGEFVRARRRASQLSQRELGELARVGARFVSELERDKPTLRVDVVNKVLAVFGKTLGVTDARKNVARDKAIER